uniref:Uncharacterized protein n=1 Tax=Candidatus Kentrum sp. LPFa TaxID=2126335 RepID=A0A450X8T5_9GAMM|nr:MAG: hypothetical protein BECKLPF1236A_GA0070988_1002810 [Candidatus Kentron sp. LPFa]VFK25696.1 MAG: hypothetical protein BECKLPF1236C_GA0070990_1002411 [Candidatus Kentron sp. LPFa]
MNIMPDYDVIDAVRPQVNRETLRRIAKYKTAELDDLMVGGLAREQVLASLESLKQVKLIEEIGAPIPELSTYLITAAGLQADEKL